MQLLAWLAPSGVASIVEYPVVLYCVVGCFLIKDRYIILNYPDNPKSNAFIERFSSAIRSVCL
jgi:hypothetical protein